MYVIICNNFTLYPNTFETLIVKYIEEMSIR